MKSYFYLFILLFFYASSFAQSVPSNLRCEYLVNPLGIDNSSPRFSWLLNDKRYGAEQKAYRLIIGTDSVAVAGGLGDVWDTHKVYSDKMLVVYAGKHLKPFTRYFWNVKLWDKDDTESGITIASFETGIMEMENWQGSWISDGHGRRNRGNSIHIKPAAYFRNEFNLPKKVKLARAYIAVGGLFELYINGEKIGDHRLDPMFTRFDRRNLYVTHDITSYLQDGRNAVGVLLGNGWYNHQPATVWYFDRAHWRNRPVFCMDMRITYEDGSVETISTNDRWKTGLSPVIFNSIYTGEHYDARLEQNGWNKTGFNDTQWAEAIHRSSPSHNIVSQQMHPIRNVEKITVKTITKIDDTTYVYDLGRNISGVSHFKVSGERGTTFRLKHAERLYPDGRADLFNIDVYHQPVDDSDPFQTDIFILSGNGVEEFMPKFNYKGFQYIEVTCDRPVQLGKDNLCGYFMHSDVPQIGSIKASNPLIGKIWKATNNSYLSNLFGYPTDCPQREKNGWTGDGHFAIEAGLYNFDGITIYEKWLADHRDEQQPNGLMPVIIPSSGWGYDIQNGTDWTSSIAIIPWNIYLFYGDSKLLADCYDNIKKYVDYVDRNSLSGLTSWGWGDWVPVKSTSSLELTSSVFFYVDALILSKAAKLFGKKEDHQHYGKLAEKVKMAINKKFLHEETGIYADGTQTELSVPLYWGVAPDTLKTKITLNLAKKVEMENYHLDVGVLGAKAILNALSENGQAETAYKLAVRDTYPSWGWWIVNGATTLYENWKIDAERDISLNHMMFGEISAWFYKGLGGIFPDEQQPGFKNIILRPNFVEELNYFEARHENPYGTVTSSWKRSRGKIIYNITVPANSTAILYLEANKITEESQNTGKTISLQMSENQPGFHMINLKSGNYNFTIQ